MDAIVTAGGTPKPDEPLYELTNGGPKALLEICGKPMIQWVLDALESAETIDRIVIIGLPPDSRLQGAKIASYLPDQGGMLFNIRSGVIEDLRVNPTAQHVLVVSSDIPTITPGMIDWAVAEAERSDVDVCYNVITRQVMETRFPGSKRTYTRLKDVEVCGGDMNVIRTITVTANDQLWERLVAARKSVVKQASIIGFDILILLLLRRVTLQGAVDKIARRVNMTGRAILSPYAEIGMDVDKPHQLELVRLDLEGHAS